MNEPKKTVLYESHLKAGAKMVDFAGFLMPIQYADGIVAEHLATRRIAGLFDVSHMGRLVVSGTDAPGFLQYVLTNDSSKPDLGQSQYTILANQAGGAVDDAYLYRFEEDKYVLVVNASNKEKDLAHLNVQLKKFTAAAIRDVSEEMAMVALQGPESENILRAVIEQGNLPCSQRNSLSIVQICQARVLLARTGYTGEPLCFELFMPSESATKIWDSLLKQGARPTGLGARDTLRLEAGLPLYGHEFGIDKYGKEIPIFACPLAKFAVSFSEEKGNFIGKQALLRQFSARQEFSAGEYRHLDDLPRLIHQLALLGRGIARAGDTVLADGHNIGYITSGTMVPFWTTENTGQSVRLTDKYSQRAIAIALVDSNIAIGSRVQIEVRGKVIDAMIVDRNLQNRKGPLSWAVLH